ncbi:MAG: prephenate dehydratase [Magnetococcales bacterium]|nr:prephenate dehydratase [Magnetococcales bacterium]
MLIKSDIKGVYSEDNTVHDHHSKQPDPSLPTTLDGLRDAIDSVDDKIHDLLMERAQYVLQVGRVKGHAPGVAFYRPEREARIHRRLEKRHRGPLPISGLHRIYREIISASLSLEKKLTVAYLGPEATFTHQAALKQFGNAFDTFAVQTIAEVFHEVEVGRADYGVVPVENSIEGVVNHTLDCFVDSPLKICAEVLLPEVHVLLSREMEISRIRKVFGHFQAIRQCRGWLDKHLPEAEVISVSSTEQAAKRAADKKRSAAVAGVYAADHFGLHVLAEHVEDDADKENRFLVVGNKSPDPSGQDKTSLMLSFRDQPGFLHRVLGVFAQQEVNLTRIESRPSRKKAWDYLFYVDFEGHHDNGTVATALASLADIPGVSAKLLGSYPLRAL